MKNLIATLILTVCVSLFSIVDAQPQLTGWLASFNTIKTGQKTSIHSDIQLRSNDDIKKIQTLLLRAGWNYHVTKKLTLTAGYAYISNRRVFTNTDVMAPEHRVWEQVLYNQKWKNIAISHRFRVEQRFIGKTTVVGDEASNTGYLFASRFRYFLRNVIPLKKGTAFNKGPFAALQNEVFLNFTHLQHANGETFDQNRFYVAGGYRLSPKADLELGYLNQYVNGRGKQFTNNHAVQLAGYLRL